MRKIFYEGNGLSVKPACLNEPEKLRSGYGGLRVGNMHCLKTCTFCEAHSHKHKWVECSYVEEVAVEWEFANETILSRIDSKSLMDAGASDALLLDYCKGYLATSCTPDIWLTKESACKPELEKLGFIRKVREPAVEPAAGDIWVYRDDSHHLLLEKPNRYWDTWCFETKQTARASFEKPVEGGWKRKQSAENVLHLIQIPVYKHNAL